MRLPAKTGLPMVALVPLAIQGPIITERPEANAKMSVGYVASKISPT